MPETTDPTTPPSSSLAPPGYSLPGNLGQAERESTNCHANTQFHDPSGMAQAVAALRAHTAALRGDSRTARAMSTEAQRLPPRSSAVIAGGVSAHLSAVRYLLGQADASAHTLLMAKDHILTGSYGFAAEALYSGVRCRGPGSCCCTHQSPI